MLDRMVDFVDRLRTVGVPVSTSEAIDASAAVSAVEWLDRNQFKAALASTLVKNSAHRNVFDSLFDIYFPMTFADSLLPDADASPDDMTKDIIDALLRMDLDLLERLAAEAIRRYAGMEQGRPVGGRYYQWKVEQALRMNELTAQLAEMMGGGGTGESQGDASGSGLSGRIIGEDARARVGELRRRIERLIRSRLVQERGPEAMARALVRPLPEEVEFLQASSDELAEMRRIIAVLARRLAARLAYKHHRARGGRLDFRKTIRRSLGTGGVPVSPAFKHRTHRPEIVIMCDVSGSVAAFSRFALALLYALSQHFNKIRSFAFVDAIDEVSSFFDGIDFEKATQRMRTEANVVWLDGHSDYGHSLREFLKRYPDAITPRTTVLLLGDMRSNFRSPEPLALHEIAEKCRKVYLLNPEPYRHWNTGDSIVAAYEEACDGVFECRNLRQLTTFIEKIA